jgi:predicted SAM-dependent methyltransferase
MVLKLNLGCHCFKLQGFVNIDIDPKVQPDIVMDLKELTNRFSPDSVDFINAGHILEHMPYEDSLKLIDDCFHILKPCSSLLVIVPNYEIASKVTSWKEAEKIILAGGDHKQIFNDEKLRDLFSKSKFRFHYNIGIENIPYMVVSNILDPKPDAWQSTQLAIKL